MPDPHFFGYGSLVNRGTHSYDDARPATLSGWRRQWRHTSLRDVAFLTVTPVPGASIQGLIAAVPNGDWAALDLREAAYDRLPVPKASISHQHPQDITVEVYKTRAEHDAAPSVRHPILHSYLDTVVSGYLDIFGREGALTFFQTTEGWDSPVLDDRATPRYPRTTPLSAETRRLVDTALDDLNVSRLRL